MTTKPKQAGKRTKPKKHNNALYWRTQLYKDKKREKEEEARRELNHEQTQQ